MTDIAPEMDRRRRRVIAGWLLLVSLMVFVMVVLGGATRLTHSGLSMADWRPVTGWLPPMSQEKWNETFDLYKQTPEFKKVNSHMTVEDFKGIFWLEFIHRLWGRIIGVAFLLPMLFFIGARWVGWPMTGRLLLLFALGGAQGMMGWLMVKSGMVDRPDVSQYRLTAHLGLAILIIGMLIWTALDILGARNKAPAPPRVRKFSQFLPYWIALVALSGGFVAGLDAGFAYNTFPLMDGGLWPEDIYTPDPALGHPWWMAAFEHIGTVQFHHRILAELTFVMVLVFWLLARGHGRSVHWFLAAGLGQVGLGIATLLMVVPVSLGVAHQGGAMVLFAVAVWVAHEMHARAPVSLRRAAP